MTRVTLAHYWEDTDMTYRMPDGRAVAVLAVTQDRLVDAEPMATVRPLSEPADSIMTYVLPLASLAVTECAGCWRDAHEGHDVGMRHEDGHLFSATCHDCGSTYRRQEAAND
jgi:hypothetical protein